MFSLGDCVSSVDESFLNILFGRSHCNFLFSVQVFVAFKLRLFSLIYIGINSKDGLKKILDTTLREEEQTPGITFSLDQKRQLLIL